jgi:omega-amidase
VKIKVSLGQINVALGQPERNLKQVRAMTAEAAAGGSQVVVFPELWSSGYDLARAEEHASALGQGLFAEMTELATQHSLHVMGSLLESRGGGCRNTAIVASPQGQVVAAYSKVHLFRPMEEDVYLVAGQEAPVFDLPWGRSALAICYDLRFPELFTRYALEGARVVFLMAEWPYPRVLHWDTLLRARAIENQFFVVACNRVGESGEWSFFGHSSVYDPSGELVAGAGNEEMLLTAVLDLNMVDEVRRTTTIFDDRREDVYTAR